ncbi:MAG: amidohydrolase family protein [Myxococcota bacterium]
MSNETLTCPVFDADNHLYETQESFLRYLPEKRRGAIDYVEVRGRTKIVIKGQISEYIPNPTFEVVAAPGAQEEYYRVGNPDGKSRREIFGAPVKSIPAWRNPEERIKLMNEQGLDRTLLFPTLASVLEERLRDDPELIHDVVHAFNEWLFETWSFNHQDRIFSTPVISLPIVDRAIEELEWVVERGAKCVLIRPAPVPGLRGSRSFGLPEFDPFWERVVEHDLLIGMHSSDSGYTRYTNEWLGGDTEFLPFQPQVFSMMQGWRAIEDSVSALICHGALSRFPGLKISVIENGSSWVAPLLAKMKDVYKKEPQGFLEDPVEVFKRNIYVSPFWEDDLPALADLIGEEHVLFGSDYPHPEGLADPVSYVAELEGASESAIRNIMGGNVARLMNVPNEKMV